MTKSRVAVLKTTPETILEDTQRLMQLAGIEQALKKGATTILKDNISWHFPFPAANTTPWQMEGTVLGLQHAGYTDQVELVRRVAVYDRRSFGQSLTSVIDFQPRSLKIRGWIKLRNDSRRAAPYNVIDKTMSINCRTFDRHKERAFVGLPRIVRDIVRDTSPLTK